MANVELFEHQKKGIAFLIKKKKAILADEMGLGKTRQAIIAAGKESDSVLVICPASLKINWQREIRMVYPDARVCILSTTETDPAGGSGWYIINYDIVEKKMAAIEGLIERGMDTLILDEAHYIKGKSIRAKAIVGGRMKKGDGWLSFSGIAKKMQRVYCLTGTPILNRPIEIFNLLKAIGHPLGKNETEFATRYCGMFWMVKVQDLETGRQFLQSQDRAYKYYNNRSRYRHLFKFPNMTGATNLDELRQKLDGSIIRRKKNQVLDLPEKIISVMEVEMDETTRREYDHAWESYLEYLQRNPIDPEKLENILQAKQLVELQKLKQVCSRAKIERIAADIQNAVEQDEKVIIFTQYTKTVEMLADKMRELQIGWVKLTGEDDMDDRQASVDSFQNDPLIKVFIGNIEAGGVGINLTAASIVMFADMDWSPEVHRQAEDRAHRLGQGGTVNVYYYVCPGTIEEDIIEILNNKKNIADQILEKGGKNRINKTGAAAAFLRLMAKKISTTGSAGL